MKNDPLLAQFEQTLNPLVYPAPTSAETGVQELKTQLDYVIAQVETMKDQLEGQDEQEDLADLLEDLVEIGNDYPALRVAESGNYSIKALNR